MDSSAYEAALDPSLHPLEVFEMVEAQMEALGCSGYKPSQIGRAATGQRGGAPALLLVSLLKCTVFPLFTLSQPSHSFVKKQSSSHPHLVFVTSSYPLCTTFLSCLSSLVCCSNTRPSKKPSRCARRVHPKPKGPPPSLACAPPRREATENSSAPH